MQSDTGRSRNWALALLFATCVLNLFDRQIVNILAQSIKRDLSISDTQLGLLTGTAFAFFYSTLGIPLGRLADHVNRVRLIAAALAVWSGFTALCGFAGGFGSLFLARMGVGIGEAGAYPASTALISDMFPESRRNFAMAVLFAGTPVGSFLGLLVGGYAGSTWGWRTAFLVAGMPGFLLAAVILLTMRDPKSSEPLQDREVPGLGATLRALAAGPRLIFVAIGMASGSFLIFAAGAWLPVFFIRVYGMSTTQIGGFSAVAVGVGGTLGMLGAGTLSDFLAKRIRHAEMKLIMVAFVLTVIAFLGTVLAKERTVALACLIFLYLCIFAFMSPTITVVQREATRESRSLAVAACMSFSNIMSSALGLPVVGAVSDALTPQYGPSAIRYALALSVVVVSCIGLLSNWRVLYSFRKSDNSFPCNPPRHFRLHEQMPHRNRITVGKRTAKSEQTTAGHDSRLEEKHGQ